MIRRLLARLFGGAGDEGGEPQTQDSEDDESGFLRSRLDASVLSSHGIGTGTAEVEEPDVSEEEAEALEQYHDDR